MIALCRTDPALEDIQLDRFSYPTRFFRVPLLPVMPKIQDIAKGLKTYLRTHHPNRSRIVLTCHSLGGLVARQLMVDLAKAGDDLGRYTLLLFACPNNGSILAEVGRNFSIGHTHLSQLGRNAAALTKLNEEWEALGIKDRIDLLFVAGGVDGVVNPDDARAFCGEDRTETIIGVNHNTIIRPTNHEETAYLILRRAALGPVCRSTEAGPETESLRRPNPLFEVYYAPDEPYYVVRNLDGVLGDEQAVWNVWLYGGSGLGKTAALRRRVILGGAIPHQVTLAGHNTDPIELLHRICESLLERTGASMPRGLDKNKLIREFCSACRNLAGEQQLVLLIEEIPGRLDGDHLEFLNLLFLCCQALELENRRHTRIYLSSIQDPRPGFSASVEKLHERILFLEVCRWSPGDMLCLVKVLTDFLQLHLTDDEEAALLAEAMGSPRFIKYFFRTWRVKQRENLSVRELLCISRREQVHR